MGLLWCFLRRICSLSAEGGTKLPLHILSGFSTFIELKRSEPSAHRARAQTWAWDLHNWTEPEVREGWGGEAGSCSIWPPEISTLHTFLPFSFFPTLVYSFFPGSVIKAEMSHRTQILILKMQKLAWWSEPMQRGSQNELWQNPFSYPTFFAPQSCWSVNHSPKCCTVLPLCKVLPRCCHFYPYACL